MEKPITLLDCVNILYRTFHRDSSFIDPHEEKVYRIERIYNENGEFLAAALRVDDGLGERVKLNGETLGRLVLLENHAAETKAIDYCQKGKN